MYSDAQTLTNPNQPSIITVTIRNHGGLPSGDVVLNKVFPNTGTADTLIPDMTFEFQAPEENSLKGKDEEDFQICFSVKPNKDDNPESKVTIDRFFFELRSMSEEDSVPVRNVDIAKEENLNNIKGRIAKLTKYVHSINEMVHHYSVEELRIHDVVDSTNSRIVYFSVGQTFVIFLLGFWQIAHLQNFFRRKKLV